MPDGSTDQQARIVHALRDRVAPTAAGIAPGTRALVTGNAAGDVDFTHQLSSATPKVIAFVLALAFLLLLAAFRSAPLAAAVMGLNLLSVGAAYGLLVAVFQHSWAEGPLGFVSSGIVVNWIPLFLFVILFGLSMDYTVLVLERIREARRSGRSAREAAAEGVGATAGTVTSAAIVMVAVFAVFAMLRMLEFKQLGVGLGAAILIDATVVRGVALPAVVALLGERRWHVPGCAAPPRPGDARGRRAGARVSVVAQATSRAVRDVAYLAVGLVTGALAAVVWAVGLGLSLGLAVLIVGLPVIVATGFAFKAVTDLDRRNAALVLGRPLRGTYRPRASGVRGQVWATLGDPQTWRDFAWLILHSVVGVVFGCLALGAVAGTLGLLVLPAWSWSLPDGADLGIWRIDTLLESFAGPLLAVPAAALTVGLARVLALGQVSLATLLLGTAGRAGLAEPPSRTHASTARRATSRPASRCTPRSPPAPRWSSGCSGR